MKVENIDSYSYEKGFVENHLIAYIGNKRRLLSLILRAIEEIEVRGSRPVNRQGFFIDYFAGSGSVSRLAKSLGFRTWANDWEDYSYVMNKAFVGDHEDVFSLFDDEGGLERVLTELNAQIEHEPNKSYISEYYCPENDQSPDVSRERLFYSRQNGVLIDNIRAAIDEKYPVLQAKLDKKISRKRNLLLALLIYESSTRSNTSGVFKGFHQGFGGRKGDALGRILKQLELTKPTLSKQKQTCFVTKENALTLAQALRIKEAEIVYLDPPYNQHQYGSNYHLLNTITRNDQPKVNREFMINGKKINKSAIRKDWVKTKSSFCYKQSAKDDFAKLIELINSKYILVSYSTEGIIAFDQMLSILAKKGKVGIVTTGYTRYRGGRQAITTKTKNIEFVIIVDTALASTQADIDNVKGVVLGNEINNLWDRDFPFFKESHSIDLFERESKVYVKIKEFDLTLPLNRQLRLEAKDCAIIQERPFSEQKKIYQFLSDAYDYTNDEAVLGLTRLLIERKWDVDYAHLAQRLIVLFNKINPKKNHGSFTALRDRILSQNNQTGFLDDHPRAKEKFEEILKVKAMTLA